MANSLSPNNLTQVAIQPVASPVSLNILPAPGQQFQGNQLQQLGESLAAFSPALQGMLARRVDEDKRMLAAQGQSVDFGQVNLDVSPDASPEEKQAALNNAFKDAIRKNNAPDSANPFFLIAARQNFGRTVGLKYRNALASLEGQATDPDNPTPFHELAQKASEMVGAEAVTSDVYGAAGFASVAQEANAEMQSRFQQELRKRNDFVALERTQQGIAEAIVTGAISDGAWTEESPVYQAAQSSIDSIQLTTTDPAVARKAVLGASVVAFSQIKDPDDLDEALSSVAKLRFGKSYIRDNPALFMEIARRKDERMDELIREGTRQDQLVNKQVDRFSREASKLGFNEQVSDAVLNGTPEKAQQALDSIIDKIVTENPDMPAVVKDELRAKMQKNLTSLAQSVQYSRNAINEAGFTDTFELIDLGVVDNMEILRQRMDDLRLPTPQQIQLRKYFEENVGVVSTAGTAYSMSNGKSIVGRIMQGMTAAGMTQMDPATGQQRLPLDKMDEAQQYETTWRIEANKHVQRFLRGDVTDPATGKSYTELKNSFGTEFANKAINSVLDSFYDKRINDLNGQFKAEQAASAANVQSRSSTGQVGFTDMVARQQKAAADNVAGVVEGNQGSTTDIDKVITKGLQSEMDDVKKVGAEVGFGYGRAFEPQQLVSHLGEMWKVASEKGSVEVNVNGFVWDSPQKFSADAVLQRYGRMKRSVTVGLDPYEVTFNQTREGLPVFGVVLPKKEDAVEFAFSIPMFTYEEQLRDPEVANDLMDALNLPANVRESFIARQATLLRVRKSLESNIDPAKKISNIK